MPDALLSGPNNITHCSAIWCVMSSCHVAGTLSLHSKFMLTLCHKVGCSWGHRADMRLRWVLVQLQSASMLSPATAQPGLEARTLCLCLDLLFLLSLASREGLIWKRDFLWVSSCLPPSLPACLTLIDKGGERLQKMGKKPHYLAKELSGFSVFTTSSDVGGLVPNWCFPPLFFQNWDLKPTQSYNRLRGQGAF